MWIKDADLVLERILKGPYPNQQHIDDLKKVYEFDDNGLPTGDIIHTKDTITVLP